MLNKKVLTNAAKELETTPIRTICYLLTILAFLAGAMVTAWTGRSFIVGYVLPVVAVALMEVSGIMMLRNDFVIGAIVLGFDTAYALGISIALSILRRISEVVAMIPDSSAKKQYLEKHSGMGHQMEWTVNVFSYAVYLYAATSIVYCIMAFWRLRQLRQSLNNLEAKQGATTSE
jgi:membrane-associated HD superfamily phosphohydrolase